MKIIKVLSKKVKGKDYHKYTVTLPKEIVKNSGLLEKQLRARVEKEKIILEKDLKE